MTSFPTSTFFNKKTKGRTRRSRKKDIRSNEYNMDMMFGGKCSNSIEKKLEIVINHSLGQGDTESILTYQIPSQQIATRNIGCRLETSRSDRPLESMEMFLGELNLRLSQVKDSLMIIIRIQISRVINSAMNDRVIPEIENSMGTLSSGQRDTESGSLPNNQEGREGSNGFKTKITEKDSRSAFDLSDPEDLSSYSMFPLFGRSRFRGDLDLMCIFCRNIKTHRSLNWFYFQLFCKCWMLQFKKAKINVDCFYLDFQASTVCRDIHGDIQTLYTLEVPGHRLCRQINTVPRHAILLLVVESRTRTLRKVV